MVFFYASSISRPAKSFVSLRAVDVVAAAAGAFTPMALAAPLKTAANPVWHLRIYSSLSALWLAGLIFYLLIILVFVVKIVESFKGAIKINLWF